MSEEKVALITGASRGIGRACAIAFGEAGYKVAIHYRSNPDLAEQVKNLIPTSSVFQKDLSLDGACEELIKDVKKEFGRIDVLVNNAGRSVDQILPFAKPADFDALIATNLKPAFLLSKAAAKIMIRQKSGNLIHISSVIGHTGNFGQSMYAATKGGLTAMSMSIAKDLAQFGIRSNCVAPGFIQTEMTSALKEEVQTQILNSIPLKRMGEGKDVAKACLFLASEGASYITGSTIHVNGGMHTQ